MAYDRKSISFGDSEGHRIFVHVPHTEWAPVINIDGLPIYVHDLSDGPTMTVNLSAQVEGEWTDIGPDDA